ncbi:hypothetical protein F945_03072 [Acinetobacter rudis CIP 110305]|uniref:Ammonium transporter AmtB-like domain-containing protein n=2 Tax=Acinetobacter rudis TaxID=632955 RepID=S3MQ51_9GAMM|nr:hypothetical protein F945_03072 [Acinetobacter rudis CIP 110305]
MGIYRYIPIIWLAIFSCSTHAAAFPLIQDVYFAPHYLLLLLGGLFVLLMQSGLAVVEGGYDPETRVGLVYAINFLAAFFGCIIYLLLSNWMMSNKIEFALYWELLTFDWHWNLLFFYMLMATTINMVVSRIMPKNISIWQYWWIALALSSIVFSINSQLISGGFSENEGFLQHLGFIDFAGATIVHSTAAWITLAGYWVFGKDQQDQMQRRDLGSDDGRLLAMALGAFILWLAWSGLNASYISTIPVNIQVIVVNTLTTIIGAMLSIKALGLLFARSISFEQLIKAALGGLVAITASCGLVSAISAMGIGMVAGALVFWLPNLIREKIAAKNIADVLVIHGVCGVWGTLAVVFSNHPVILVSGNISLWVQLLGVVVNFIWSFSAAWLLFSILTWYRKKFKKEKLTPVSES